MKKFGSFLFLCALACACYYAGTILGDRQTLTDQWIRIHVVANSDSREDQTLKRKVRNGILAKLETGAADAQTMMADLEDRLPEIRQTAQDILLENGCTDRALVTLQKEAFPQRDTEGLRLPAGIYQTLRVTIGEGGGHNWWGVLFPQLCYGEEQNVSASLTDSLTKDNSIRFFFLEKLGRLENCLAGK